MGFIAGVAIEVASILNSPILQNWSIVMGTA